MEDRGWIKIHRKIYDNPYASDPHWVALWVWMLCRATRTERRARIGKTTKTFNLEPGQFISGRKQMAEETGIDESKIRRLLKLMKNDHQIDQRTSASGSLFTVLNWDEHQNVTNETTNRRPTSDQQMTTKQECKKVRSIRVRDKMPSLDEWKSHCRTLSRDWPDIDIENAWNHYESSGWKRGKTKISKWRSCASTCYNNWKSKYAKTRSNRDAGTLNAGTIDRANDELF
jgi:hypothetical protein